MRHGKTVHVSELRLGDVVRLIHAPSFPVPQKAGSTDDFREGYDAMTVVFQDEKYVTFHRPHIEIYSTDETKRVNHMEVSVEIVSHVPRDHTGLYYELLSYGPVPRHCTDGQYLSHWEDKN